MTQFKVKVIGSLRNGYTATAEKVIASNVPNLSNVPTKKHVSASAPVSASASASEPESEPESESESEPEPVLTKEEINARVDEAIEAQPLALKQTQQKLKMGFQKFRKMKVMISVQIAEDAARLAAREARRLLAIVGRGMIINSNSFIIAENAMTTAKAAVTAAHAAVNTIINADEAIKATIVNNEIENLIGTALTISKNAEVLMKAAIDTINTINEGTSMNSIQRNMVIEALNEGVRAFYIWANIYNKINGMKGGRRTYRKRIHRTRTYRK